MLSPFATKLDPPALRIGWLEMMLRVFKRHDRDGLYQEMIAITERLIAAAERERRDSQGGAEKPRTEG
jgi:hypothetical protein